MNSDAVMDAQPPSSSEVPSKRQEEESQAAPNHYSRMLASLEERVDLMAKMQSTRATIQERARAIKEMSAWKQCGTRLRDECVYDREQMCANESDVHTILA